MKKKVVSIVGPTAVGKTALGIAAAKKFRGKLSAEIPHRYIRGWISVQLR